MAYQNILIATAFSARCESTLNHAKMVAEAHNAKLSIVHFIEPLPASAFSYAGAIDVDNQRLVAAKRKLEEVGASLGIDKADQHVREALPKAGIVELAKKLNVDLILVGNHRHPGVVLAMLGTTADAVAHHAHCDVLIIK
jgi:universal stress protein A